MASAKPTTRQGLRDAAESLALGEDAPAMSLVADEMRKHAARVRSEADQIIAALLEGLPDAERAAILAHAYRGRKGSPATRSDPDRSDL